MYEIDTAAVWGGNTGEEIADGSQGRICKKVVRIPRSMAHGTSEWELGKVRDVRCYVLL